MILWSVVGKVKGHAIQAFSGFCEYYGDHALDESEMTQMTEIIGGRRGIRTYSWTLGQLVKLRRWSQTGGMVA